MSDNTIADLQMTVANAAEEYARQNGDGFHDHDWMGANEYRAEGVKLGEAAFRQPEDGRQEYIDEHVDHSPASARYLISWAATLRIAECERAAKPEPGHSLLIDAMFDIAKAGAPKPHIIGEK